MKKLTCALLWLLSEPGSTSTEALPAGNGSHQETSSLIVIRQVIKRDVHSSAERRDRNCASRGQCRPVQDGAVSVLQRERLLSLRRQVPVCAWSHWAPSYRPPSTLQDWALQGIPHHRLLCIWRKVIWCGILLTFGCQLISNILSRKQLYVVVGCWCSYLSGSRCILAYGSADATATHCLLLQ